MRWMLLFLMASIASLAQAKEFHGMPCTKDCSGHRAGYEWAKKKQLTNPEACRGRSRSFVTGCRIWVQKHQAPKTSQ